MKEQVALHEYLHGHQLTLLGDAAAESHELSRVIIQAALRAGTEVLSPLPAITAQAQPAPRFAVITMEVLRSGGRVWLPGGCGQTRPRCTGLGSEAGTGLGSGAALQEQGSSEQAACWSSDSWHSNSRLGRETREHHPECLEGLANELTGPSACSLLPRQPGSSTVWGPGLAPALAGLSVPGVFPSVCWHPGDASIGVFASRCVSIGVCPAAACLRLLLTAAGLGSPELLLWDFTHRDRTETQPLAATPA
ncbi:unnamed protein product [Coccothraustes coccothraustes]